MLCPGIDQENLHITIRGFGITVNPPAVSPVATPYAGVFIDRPHKLRFVLSNDLVFDCHQHRSLAKLSRNLLDHSWKPPVVPRTQIGRRVRKPCKQNERDASDCSHSRIQQRGSNAGALRYRSPKRAASSKASLINENEDGKDARPY